MSKTIAYAGALAAALLVASAGSAAAQSESGSIDAGSISETMAGLDVASLAEYNQVEGGYLGSLGDVAPTSVTGSLPGYATGPLGSTATAVCNIGVVAGFAANVTGIPLALPATGICSFLTPVAASGDAFLKGDYQGSVDSVIAGVPVVGGFLSKWVDTSSLADRVGESVGEDPTGSLGDIDPGSLTEADPGSISDSALSSGN